MDYALALLDSGDAVLISDEQPFVYEPDWYGQGVRCPDRWLKLFTDIEERELKQELPVFHEFRTRMAFRWEIVEDGATIGLDYVLYEGESTEIDFHAMREAVLLFSLDLSEHGEQLEAAAAVHAIEHEVQGSLETEGKHLPLRLGKKPANRYELFHE